MLSEKAYWAILIGGLVTFILSIEFVLVPFGKLSYDLGIDLIAESIGILFTIVFLVWLFSLRQKIQWESARKQLYKELSARLSKILSHIFFFIDQKPLDDMHRADFLKRLDELSSINAEDFTREIEIQLHLVELEFVATLYCWSRDDKEFISMEMHHFQSFFNPELRVHLLDLLHYLALLEFWVFRRKEQYTTRERFLTETPKMLHAIIKEISELNRLGVEIYPYAKTI